MKMRLIKFAVGFIYGVLAMLALTAMYGPTGWNALITFVILTAYITGRAIEAYGRTR